MRRSLLPEAARALHASLCSTIKDRAASASRSEASRLMAATKSITSAGDRASIGSAAGGPFSRSFSSSICFVREVRNTSGFRPVAATRFAQCSSRLPTPWGRSWRISASQTSTAGLHSSHCSSVAESYARTSFQRPSLFFSAHHSDFFWNFRGVTYRNVVRLLSRPSEFLVRLSRFFPAFTRGSSSTLSSQPLVPSGTNTSPLAASTMPSHPGRRT